MDENKRLHIKSLTPTLGKLFGCHTPEHCFTAPVEEVCQTASHTFGGEFVQKGLICIADAFGDQLRKKSLSLFKALAKLSQCEIPMISENPSYNVVCNASLLSGVSPYTHGLITQKPQELLIDTAIDCLQQKGLKVCLITESNSSLQFLLRQKPISIICEDKYQITNRATELLQSEEHDFIIVHWPQYYHALQTSSVLDPVALEQAQYIVDSYMKILEQASLSWRQHNRVIAFTPNHGGTDSGISANSRKEETFSDFTELTHFWSLYHGKTPSTETQ